MTTPQQTRENIEQVFSLIESKPRSQRELCDITGFIASTIRKYIKTLKDEKKIYIAQYKTFTVQRKITEAFYGAGNLPDSFKTKTGNAKLSAMWRERIRNGYVPTPKPVKAPQPTVVPEFSRQSWYSALECAA